MNRNFQYLLTFLFLGAVLIWAAVAQTPDKNLHLFVLDVGQGDSILLKTPTDKKVLIDGGPDDKVLGQLGQTLPFYDKKIDLVILTHPDADHLTGLVDVIKNYEVGEIWATGVIHTTDTYLNWLNLVKEKQIPYKIAFLGTNADFGDQAKLEVLWPPKSLSGQKADNNNNTSLVTKLSYLNFCAILPGDGENEVLDNLNLIDSHCQVLKASHHGSNDAASVKLLQQVSPKLVVISVGKDNKFGHPQAKALDIYKKYSNEIFRTDLNGRVEIITNGQNFWTKTAR